MVVIKMADRPGSHNVTAIITFVLFVIGEVLFYSIAFGPPLSVAENGATIFVFAAIVVTLFGVHRRYNL
jgi:hypothetical protein